MRLLFITQDFPPGIGGIQTYSAEHAAQLSSWCEDFLLICPDERNSEIDDSIFDFDIKRIPVRNHLLFVPLIRKLPDLLKRRSFDVTFHAQWQTVWPAITAKKRGFIKKIFVAAHARELLYNPYRFVPVLGWLYEKRRKALLQKVDHFFPVSDFTAGLLMKQGVVPEKISVVVNGTDPDLFRPMDATALKKELKLEGKQVLMTVTRLVRRKGIDTVLEAIAQLRAEFKDIRYLILGTGPEEKRLKEMVRNLGISEHVRFMGKTGYRDLPKYYNLADLFVLSSRTELPDVEGFGIVFLEANACEKPVIGTNSGGVPSAISNGRTGLIVRENNPAELAKAIRSILTDPQKAAEMGKKGRKQVLEKTNWKVLSRELLDLMKGELEAKSGTARKQVAASKVRSESKTAELASKPEPESKPAALASKPEPESKVEASPNAKLASGTKTVAEMKRVLMISPYFLPRRRVGSLRPFKFAAHLREHGWDPYVLTIKSQESFTELEEEMVKGIEILEIDPKLDLTIHSGSQLKMEKSEQNLREGKSEAGALRSLGKAVGFRNFAKGIANMIDRHFPLDTWLLLFFKELRQIREMAAEVNADVIWSTGDPWSSHWLANKLSREMKLPWVADFRDPWTLGGVQLRSRSAFSKSIDRKFEQTVVDHADVLTFTSDSTEKLYRGYYPALGGRTATITNSFDRKFTKGGGEPEIDFDGSYLNLVFFGKFRGLSPAAPVIELLNRIGQRDLNILNRIRIYSFGSLDPEDRSLAEGRGVLENFIIEKPVHPESGPSLLKAADILLLSTDPRRVHIIPAKLWDYLAAGGPVLSIAPNPEIGDILEKTGTGIQFLSSEREACVDLLTKCVHAKMKNEALPVTSSLNRDVIEQYEARHTAGLLAEVLNQLTE